MGFGAVCRLTLGEPPQLERMTFDTEKPNGILVAPDGQTVYVAETNFDPDGEQQLRAYPVESDGSLGTYRVLHNFSPHRGIDGMCFDADGHIVATAGWTESGPGPMIYVFSPEGRVIETHPFPGEAPTNCVFGGDDLQTLYVTGHEGRLHRAETERTGYLQAPSGHRYLEEL